MYNQETHDLRQQALLLLVVDDRSKLLQNLRQKAKASVGKLVVCPVRFCL
jgi:hypothetical protein